MILKLLYELTRNGRENKRQRYYYIKERDETKFLFQSDVGLQEQDLRKAMEIIQSNVSQEIQGNVTASQLVDLFAESKVVSVDISVRGEGKGWLIRLSDNPSAFKS